MDRRICSCCGVPLSLMGRFRGTPLWADCANERCVTDLYYVDGVPTLVRHLLGPDEEPRIGAPRRDGVNH